MVSPTSGKDYVRGDIEPHHSVIYTWVPEYHMDNSMEINRQTTVQCKTTVSPLRYQWRYCSRALSHRHNNFLQEGGFQRPAPSYYHIKHGKYEYISTCHETYSARKSPIVLVITKHDYIATLLPIILFETNVLFTIISRYINGFVNAGLQWLTSGFCSWNLWSRTASCHYTFS